MYSKEMAHGYSGLVLAVGLCLPQTVLGAKPDDGLDRAMQDFVQAVQSRSSQGVLAAFSRTTPWKYLAFHPITDKLESQVTVSYAEMAREFKARKGEWYYMFMENRPTEHFRDENFRGQKWLRRGTTFYSNSKEPKGFYIKWRQEGDRWVIAEIRDYLGI